MGINETEIEKLETKTKEAEQWLNDKIEAQSEKSLKDTPEFFSHDVYLKIEPVVNMAKKLLARPKPRGWGKKKKATNETATANATSSTNETDAAEEDLTASIEVDDESEEIEEEESGEDDDKNDSEKQDL